MQKFLTLAETARAADVPASRVQALIAADLITPAGRAGSSKNAPIIFREEDLIFVRAALGGTAAPMRPHLCASTADVRAKYEAFLRARKEAAK